MSEKILSTQTIFNGKLGMLMQLTHKSFEEKVHILKKNIH